VITNTHESAQLLVCARGMLFVTESGHQLRATAFKRTLGWTTLAEGRRSHDLRHTAACLWLARGVDPVTVQAWMAPLNRDPEPVPARPRNLR
jgi:integrase